MKTKHNKSIKCPYCGSKAILRNSSYVHGSNSLKDEYLYVCSHYPECNSYVSVNKKTLEPKGILANGDLRHKRIEAHKLINIILDLHIMKKNQIYKYLQAKFSLNKTQTHIAKFTDYMCEQTINELKKILINNHVSI